MSSPCGDPCGTRSVLVCKESHDVEVSALRDEELIEVLPYVTIITPNLPESWS